MPVTRQQRRWGELAPRTVEYEFARLVARAREQLRSNVTLDPDDPCTPFVERLRASGQVHPESAESLAAIERAQIDMLVERGRQWNVALGQEGSELPTTAQWQNMARMAVVRAFLDQRTWGVFTLDALRKRLGDAVRERRRQRRPESRAHTPGIVRQ
jgi:hypothetical protein